MPAENLILRSFEDELFAIILDPLLSGIKILSLLPFLVPEQWIVPFNLVFFFQSNICKFKLTFAFLAPSLFVPYILLSGRYVLL